MKNYLQNNLLLLFLFLIFFVSCTVAKREEVKDSVVTPVISIKEEPSLAEKIKVMKKQKDFKNIIDIYEKNKDEIYDFSSLSYVMEAYYLNKKYKDVISLGDRITNLFPNYQSGQLSLMLGIAYYHNDLYEAARRNLVKAKELGIKNQLLTLYLIDLYIKKGQHSLAIIETSDLVEENKNYWQGVIYFSDANYEKALERFSQSNNIEKSVLYKAYCLYKLNKHDELINLWENGLLKESKELYTVIANVYFKKGEIMKAKEVLENVVLKNDSITEKNIKFINENYILERTKLE